MVDFRNLFTDLQVSPLFFQVAKWHNYFVCSCGRCIRAWSLGKYDDVFLQSSLLMTMMGELRIIEGNLFIKGSIGYVPQQAWVFSGSVKQNIVFGQAFEEDRYDKVMSACCLEQVRICFSFYQYFNLTFLSFQVFKYPLMLRIHFGRKSRSVWKLFFKFYFIWFLPFKRHNYNTVQKIK